MPMAAVLSLTLALCTTLVVVRAETFTTCGAVGRFGPTQAQCDAAYGAGVVSVPADAGIQHFTVPTSGTYRIDARGAQGYAATLGISGGAGAEIGGEFALVAGQVLQIAVGQAHRSIDDSNGGGGGGTFVVDLASGQPLLVAGGGGGVSSRAVTNPCNAQLGELGGVGTISFLCPGTTRVAGSERTGGAGLSTGMTNFGAGGGGFDTDGEDDLFGVGGRSFLNGLVGGASLGVCFIPDPKNDGFGGFGGGGSGNGCFGGGGGGGYSGGDGGGMAGGGGSFNSGANPTAVVSALVAPPNTQPTQGEVVFTLISSASGDPHLRGAHGERYDFNGQPNGIYSLFSTPQFVVNMHLLPEGPENRFIDAIGVVFRNVSMHFDTHVFDAAQKSTMLNKKLAPVGGRAIVTPFNVELELCDGHRVHISQRITDFKFPNKASKRFYHLDVDVQVPGCHDSYGGALGQTYQCKYARGEQFDFDHATEESFRVKQLSTPSGSFAVDAPCHDMSVFAGQQPMSGGSIDHRTGGSKQTGAVLSIDQRTDNSKQALADLQGQQTGHQSGQLDRLGHLGHQNGFLGDFGHVDHQSGHHGHGHHGHHSHHGHN